MFKINLFLIFLLSCLNSCIDPFDAEIVDFESAIVIEALLTNEMKRHEIGINRTFTFEDRKLLAEKNANVMVVDDAGNSFNFRETTDGLYLSEIPFAIVADRSYRLLITTENGNNYNSEEEFMPAVTQINELRSERITNDAGEDGIAILIDSFDPNRSSNFYRYTFEETYKIIAPKWSPLDLIGDPDSDDECAVTTVSKETEQKVCYTSDASNTIILTNTTDLEEDRVAGFQVHFINRNNYIISHRYSILVKQHIQSNGAFLFYEKLKEFSGNESIFSETQPGFLEGNIKSENNTKEKVIGYFEVASVSEQRLFFNYEDFYAGEELPPYVVPCDPNAPGIRGQGGACILRPTIESGREKFYQENGEPGPFEGPYLTVNRICGDCTALGEINIPEFWVE
ncbi:MAG: DUF4249 domain-containing protein [Maribacter sp.]